MLGGCLLVIVNRCCWFEYRNSRLGTRGIARVERMGSFLVRERLLQKLIFDNEGVSRRDLDAKVLHYTPSPCTKFIQ